MSQISYEARLERLLRSGLCTGRSPQKHIRELRKLTEQMDEADIKRRSYMLKALADPTRIKILRLLKQRPMCNCEITAALGLTGPNASHHLNLLKRNEIVTSEKIGKWVLYKLQQSTIQNLMSDMTG